MITIQKFVFNPFSVNTWLIHDDSGTGVLIDPACQNLREKDFLSSYCKSNKLFVAAILNTHGHFDHTCGIKWAHDHFQCPFYAHKEDEVFFKHASEQARSFGFELTDDPPMIDRYLIHHESMQFGDMTLKIRHAPGHSPGSVVIYEPNAEVVFTGDVLFKRSIGRTDLPGGDYDLLMDSIHTQLLNLSDDIRILPGHGPESTMGSEKLNNPFLG